MTQPDPPVYSAHDLGSQWLNEYLERAEALAEGRALGPSTGLPEVDSALGGYLTPGIHTLQGPPGVGKTAFVNQTAADCGCAAISLSTEMSPVENFIRHGSRITGTKMSELHDPSLDLSRLIDIALETAEQLGGLTFVDARTRVADLPFIVRLAERVRRDLRHPLLLVIDSFQVWARMTALGGLTSEYEQISSAIRMMADLSATSNIAVLAVAHRNRAGQERGGLYASKGSGDIEYASETIFELTSNGDDRPNASGERGMLLTVHKNRSGQAGGRFQLAFRGDYQKFTIPQKGRRRSVNSTG